jgi:hypothetical protein
MGTGPQAQAQAQSQYASPEFPETHGPASAHFHLGFMSAPDTAGITQVRRSPMSPKRHVLGTAAAVLLVGGMFASPAFAQTQPTPGTPQAQPTPGISWQQAIQTALGAVPGTVLEQEMEWFRGNATTAATMAMEVEIRPQDGGPVREVVIDASTGAVLQNNVDGPDFRMGTAGGAFWDD